MPMPASAYNKLVRVERPILDDAADGAGSGSWAALGDLRAQIRDLLPSRSEDQSGGFATSTRPARVRMRYRTDIESDMRFVLLRHDDGEWVPTDRIMEIVSGPAELGRRDGIEFMVEDYSPAGNAA